jgi:hypothetical protein
MPDYSVTLRVLAAEEPAMYVLPPREAVSE